MSLTPAQIKALIERKKQEVEAKKREFRTKQSHGGGITTPLPSGVTTPLPGGIQTPLPGGIRTPLPGGIRTPLPGGIRTPLPGGLQTPLPSQPQLNSLQLQNLQDRVQAQLAQQRRQQGQHKKSLGVIMSSSGVMLDAEGNEIKLQRRAPELSVNVRAKQHEELTKLSQTAVEDVTAQPYYDESVIVKSKTGRRRGFQTDAFRFKEPGYYKHVAERQRASEKLEKLQNEIAKKAQKTHISSVAKLAFIAPKKEELIPSIVPDVEWWDQVVLEGGYDNIGRDSYPEITSLVQHPLEFDAPNAKKTEPLPVYLTKKEFKKMRRRRRKAEHEEKQEKIRLGLIEPPAPKVKISNLMRVLGTEAVQDPTKIEAMVREQMQLRQQAHQEHNEKNKLTKEQRSAKRAKKLEEDVEGGVTVAVFRVRSLRNESHKFKVDKNAKQLNLTGVAVMTDGANVIVVEGGPKSIKKYKRLLMHRIKWQADAAYMNDEDDEDDEDADDAGTKLDDCQLVWEGMALRPSFRDFRMKLFASEALAREFMDKRKCAQYWDLSLTSSVVQAANAD
eukprot:m.267693 g.267693  ORF g.267693 m.267693 type:complete len:558 (+) comp15645_c0_seq6:2013-3686(+)